MGGGIPPQTNTVSWGPQNPKLQVQTGSELQKCHGPSKFKPHFTSKFRIFFQIFVIKGTHITMILVGHPDPSVPHQGHQSRG